MPDVPQAHDSIMGSPWKAHAEAQRQSGLSRAEYCRRHNLSYHALTYWVKKLWYIVGMKIDAATLPDDSTLLKQMLVESSSSF